MRGEPFWSRYYEPQELRITVADGAKLNLDFKCKITTRTLRIWRGLSPYN